VGKWLFQLINEQGTWQTLLGNKYVNSKTLPRVEIKPGDSHFLQGLPKFKLKDGFEARF